LDASCHSRRRRCLRSARGGAGAAGATGGGIPPRQRTTSPNDEAALFEQIQLLGGEATGVEFSPWLEAVAGRRSDGIIAALPSLGEAQLHALQELETPVVVIDPTDALPERVATIGATNWAGAFTATERLLDLGHTRIGIIAGPSHVNPAVQRLEGYAAALRRRGIRFDPDLVVEAEFRITTGHHAAAALLDRDERPTAVLCSSDQQAAGLYEAARERDIRIPSELSVIGFDDTVLSRYLSPALTTVHQPLAEMAAEAIRLVQQLAIDPKAHVARRFELATHLVERRSAVALDLSDVALATASVALDS